MLARRFLGCVFVLTLLVVMGAMSMYLFGDRILMRMATPAGHFRQPDSPAPDYTLAKNWLAKPGVGEALTTWRPANAPFAPTAPVRAATFFIHPTTYLANDRWNAPIAGGGEPDERARLFVQSQTSAFADMSDIWAPRYRQAAFGAFLLNNRDAAQALALAYGDVLKAFDTFLTAQPSGRPIILAGHSQGSQHLLRLLVDRRAALSSRLVAAYVVGWPVSRVADLPSTGLQPCVRPESIGCVLSWQSFGDPANPSLILDAWEKSPGRDAAHRQRDMICTNPLTGTDNGIASPGANQGTLLPNGSLTSATLVPDMLGARCHSGLLIIDGAVPNMGPYVLPGNNYHVYDYALWWGSIRADANQRLAAWEAR